MSISPYNPEVMGDMVSLNPVLNQQMNPDPFLASLTNAGAEPTSLKVRGQVLMEKLKGNPPWWQWLKKIFLNFFLLLVFGAIYAGHVNSTMKPDGTNDHWSLPEMHDGASIFFYATAVIHYTIGYGDFYPLSAPAKAITTIHILLTFFFNMFI